MRDSNQFRRKHLVDRFEHLQSSKKTLLAKENYSDHAKTQFTGNQRNAQHDRDRVSQLEKELEDVLGKYFESAKSNMD